MILLPSVPAPVRARRVRLEIGYERSSKLFRIPDEWLTDYYFYSIKLKILNCDHVRLIEKKKINGFFFFFLGFDRTFLHGGVAPLTRVYTRDIWDLTVKRIWPLPQSVSTFPRGSLPDFPIFPVDGETRHDARLPRTTGVAFF